MSVYEELDTLRPLKKLQSDYKKTLEKIDTYESHKEEWQSELSKAMDNLELTKAELSNVNNQVRSLIQSLMKESCKNPSMFVVYSGYLKKLYWEHLLTYDEFLKATCLKWCFSRDINLTFLVSTTTLYF